MTTTRIWDDVTVGETVPAFQFQVTSLKAASVPTVTLDPFAAHYDIDVAQSLGLEALSINTMQLIGLVNRHATDWAGPGAFIMRQDVKIIRPAYQGYELTVSGEVVACFEHPEEPESSGCAEISSRIVNQEDGKIITATVVVALPRRRISAA